MSEFSTFANGEDCRDCESYEKEIEKLKAENQNLKTKLADWQNGAELNELYISQHETITKLQKKVSILTEALRLVIDDASKPIEQIDGYFIGSETLDVCKKALKESESVE